MNALLSSLVSSALNIKGSFVVQFLLSFFASSNFRLGAEIIAVFAQAWGMYLMYCALHVAILNGQLAKAPIYVRAVSYAMIAVMAVVDVLCNLTIASLVFVELPRFRKKTILKFTIPVPETVSNRCSEHLQDATWRGTIARWVCLDWLNPIMPGHCH